MNAFLVCGSQQRRYLAASVVTANSFRGVLSHTIDGID
jgi:hypothetical protein